MQVLFRKKAEFGKFEEFTRALENSQRLTLDEIAQLKKEAQDRWYGRAALPGRQDSEPATGASQADEQKKLEALYNLPPSSKWIAPGSQQQKQLREAQLSQVNDINAKQRLYEELNIAKTISMNDMGGVLDYQTDFDKMREAEAAAQQQAAGGLGAEEAGPKPSQYSQAKYHPADPFVVFDDKVSQAPPQSIHDWRK